MSVETDAIQALQHVILAGRAYYSRHGNCGAPIDQEAADAFKNAMDTADKALDAYAKPDVWADDAEIDQAREAYQTDDVEIDDREVKRSEGDGGVWVQAWVWLAKEEEDEDDACPNCGETAQDGSGKCVTCGADLEEEEGEDVQE